jgi:hypothetical protein
LGEELILPQEEDYIQRGLEKKVAPKNSKKKPIPEHYKHTEMGLFN